MTKQRKERLLIATIIVGVICTAVCADVIDRYRLRGSVSKSIRQLESADAEQRQEAASSLGEMGPQAQEALPGLRALLEDPHVRVRLAAATALWKIDREAEPLLAMLHDTWFNDLFKSILRTGATDGLEKNVEESAQAFIALRYGLIVDQQAVLAIAKALHSEDIRVRRMAALTFGTVDSFAAKGTLDIGKVAESAIPDLIGSIQDDDPWVQAFALSALASMGPVAKAAIPALREEVRKRRPRVCGEIATLFGWSQQPAISLAVLTQRISWDAVILNACAKALTKIDVQGISGSS